MGRISDSDGTGVTDVGVSPSRDGTIATMPLEIGSRLGHYDVTALIGEGRMGQVYRATDTKLRSQLQTKASQGRLRYAARPTTS